MWAVWRVTRKRWSLDNSAVALACQEFRWVIKVTICLETRSTAGIWAQNSSPASSLRKSHFRSSEPLRSEDSDSTPTDPFTDKKTEEKHKTEEGVEYGRDSETSDPHFLLRGGEWEAGARDWRRNPPAAPCSRLRRNPKIRTLSPFRRKYPNRNYSPQL